ncbi:ankyrin repeat domain-containing protein [Paenibacillus sp. ClWae2A]|uniref:ankyrin repeat domain-containing protein n=1 Tax=Paenibacillus sp. ClWae2A TaxID=3057177 RepID=UPI0028F50210|nr:ankyrin repeat domain-containing protein [Paenibacillus sp. ClWae2A]MDT9721950.1 ankyrin repeat domain-containing protein [Paenibacillus sp. ClWae2A]
MATKKATLPAHMEKLVKDNDIATVKEVFEQCEWVARGGYSKGTALSFRHISDELVRWLIEQGADINARDKYQRTPLHAHASHWSGNVPLFLELGADLDAVDYQNETPLHAAVSGYRTKVVQELVNQGATINVENKQGNTPLAKGLVNCRNSDIVNLAEIAAILLDAGASVTPDMKESVKRIGKDFEFVREKFNKDKVDGVSDALIKLYQLFDVEPVANRIMHDGTAPIQVKATTWPKQHQELWEYLIPAQGHAQTVQGEVIRITGRVSHEVLDNGGGNWDAEYRKMLDALIRHLGTGAPLAPALLQEATDLVSRLRNGYDFDAPARLSELAVLWVLSNPQPVAIEKPEYTR